MAHYHLRYSNQAKYLQLKISYRGLELVVPTRKKFSSADLQAFIEGKQAWIEKNVQKYALTETAGSHAVLPAHIHLKALNQVWAVEYLQTEDSKVTLHPNLSYQLTLMGHVQNQAKCIQKLRGWLVHNATEYLVKQLTQLSEETGLLFEKITIRNNTTRWGSCSHKKHISVCCKLLFIKAELVRHVLLHELCHTQFMNHGQSFWNLLLKYDSAAKCNAKELNSALRDIPHWIR